MAAALPGGDPLAAALAAGETPSPEMVAAAGESSALSPLLAITALVVTLLFLVAYAALSDIALITPQLPLEKSPEVLADRAREVSRRLGYDDAPVDFARNFSAAADYLRFARDKGEGATTRQRLRTGRPPGLLFWYRTSPRPMVPTGGQERVTTSDPPMTITNMRMVVLDSEGRLVGFHAVPPQLDRATDTTPAARRLEPIVRSRFVGARRLPSRRATLDAAHVCRSADGVGRTDARLARADGPARGGARTAAGSCSFRR